VAAASAILDVNAADKGILIPQVSLTGTSSASPVTSPATSLLVYNTATVSDITPGYYYWDGTKWVRLATNKFNINFTNGNGTATGVSTNYFYISATGTLLTTGQNVTPNMSGAAPVNGAFIFTATSQCVLNKINLWLNFGSTNRTFTIDCYKYTQVANATALPSGTALIASTNVVSSATALGNVNSIINGNTTIIQPGDVVCLMIKYSGTSNNLYLSGSLEFMNIQ
jgi:hypothetical protein